MGRREFVGSGAALAGALALGLVGCSTDGGKAGPGAATDPHVAVEPRPDAGTPRRVVVVGAGLAGLTTALDLVDAGWDVVVVEARPRVGGRVHTLEGPASGLGPGLHVEGGGESIDDDHDRIQALLKRFGLPTERRANKLDTGVVSFGGRRRAIAALLQEEGGKVATDYARVDAELAKVSEGVDPEHPERAAHAEQLDRRSMAQFLDGLHLVPEARALVDVANGSEYNTTVDRLSMLFVAQQTVVSQDYSAAGVETMRIAGGNRRLPEAMAAELGSRVVLGAPLERVDRHDGWVRVTAGGRTHDAAHLVLAVPPPPLRKVRFSPPLPASVAGAIAEVDLGQATKVVTEYQRPFWRADGESGFSITDLPYRVTWDAADSYATDAGLLSAFVTGPEAVKLAGMSDGARIARAQSQVHQVFPRGVGLTTGRATSMAWPAEPFTGGGYSVYRPGQMTTRWPAFRGPVGPIRFAGEHTEALSGYMESAVRSGHRVAAAIGRPR